jgi:DNA-directed RNA polymerase specialized sigma24 family protein
VDGKTRAHFVKVLPTAYPAVLARAVTLVRRRRWFLKRYGSEKEAAEELAQDAVLRTMSGKRTWDPAKVPDLDYFLSGVMRSILSAARKSPTFLTRPLSTVPVAHDSEEASSADEVLGTLDDRARGGEDPEEQLLDNESYSMVVDRALDAAGEDASAAKVVDAVVDGCEKVAEIANTTGLTAEQVYAATRKIRDRVRKGAKR